MKRIFEQKLWIDSGCAFRAEDTVNDNHRARAACPIDRHVAAQLRARRLALGLSQKDVAAVVGVTMQQFQKYEYGTNRVTAGQLYRLAAALDVPVGWFFDGLTLENCDAP